LSLVLGVPLSFLFDEGDPVRAPAVLSDLSEEPAEAFCIDPLRRSETTELVDAYTAIGDADVLRRLVDLARAVAAEAAPGDPVAGSIVAAATTSHDSIRPRRRRSE
jgi:hypothetical protein